MKDKLMRKLQKIKESIFHIKMSKKVIVIGTASIILIAFLCGIKGMQVEAYDNSEPFSNGVYFNIDGDCYLVETEEQLATILENTDPTHQFNYRLTQDITYDINGKALSNKQYTAEFDGDGYQINIIGQPADINIKKDENLGVLFGEIAASGSVHDLIITAPNDLTVDLNIKPEITENPTPVRTFEEGSSTSTTVYYITQCKEITTTKSYDQVSTNTTYQVVSENGIDIISDDGIAKKVLEKALDKASVSTENMAWNEDDDTVLIEVGTTENEAINTDDKDFSIEERWQDNDTERPDEEPETTKGESKTEYPTQIDIPVTYKGTSYIVKTIECTKKIQPITYITVSYKSTFAKYQKTEHKGTVVDTKTSSVIPIEQVSIGLLAGKISSNVSNIKLEGKMSVNQHNKETDPLIQTREKEDYTYYTYEYKGEGTGPIDDMAAVVPDGTKLSDADYNFGDQAYVPTVNSGKTIVPELNAGSIAGTFEGTLVQNAYVNNEISVKVSADETCTVSENTNVGGYFGTTRNNVAVEGSFIEQNADVVKDDKITNDDSDQKYLGQICGNVDGNTLTLKSNYLAAKKDITKPLLGGNQTVTIDNAAVLYHKKDITELNSSGKLTEVPKTIEGFATISSNALAHGYYNVSRKDADGIELVPTWLQSDVLEEVISRCDVISGNLIIDLEQSKLKNRQLENYAITLKYMTSNGMASKVLDGTISGYNIELNLKDHGITSSKIYMDEVLFSDTKMYYTWNSDKSIQNAKDQYHYEFKDAIERVDLENSETDYIIATITKKESVTASDIEDAKFYYRSANSEEEYQSADVTANEDSATARIKFVDASIQYEGVWEIDGVVFENINSKNFTVDDREPIKDTVLNCIKYQIEKDDTDKVSDKSIPVNEIGNDCVRSQTFQIEPVFSDETNYKYYVKVCDTNEEYMDLSDGYEIITDHIIDLVKLNVANDKDDVKLVIARTKGEYKPSFTVFPLHLIDDWDDIEVSLSSNQIIWGDENAVFTTPININDTNTPAGFDIKGIRYAICSESLNDQVQTLRNVAKDPDIAFKSGTIENVTANGTEFTAEIPMDCVIEKAPNSKIYFYYQIYGSNSGEDYCGKIRTVVLERPAVADEPNSAPYTGNDISSAKQYAIYPNDPIFLELEQSLIVYSDKIYGEEDVVTNDLNYEFITDKNEINELDQKISGDKGLQYVTEGQNTYICCNNRWYMVSNVSVFDEQNSITIDNTSASPIYCYIKTIAFQTDKLPNKDALFCYQISTVEKAKEVTAYPSSNSNINRYKSVYLYDETPNAEIYYMVASGTEDFTAAQKNLLQSVTYGEANEIAGVFQYDSTKGIKITTKQSQCKIMAVAIGDKSTVSNVAEFTYIVKDETPCEIVSSIPEASNAISPTVNPGDKIFLKSKTPGAQIYYSLSGSVAVVKDDKGEWSVKDSDKVNTLLYEASKGIEMPQPDDSETKTFQLTAVAVKENMEQSDAITFQYLYPDAVTAPYSTTAQGQLTIGSKVKLLCDTADAYIYYTTTTDGSTPKDPTISDVLYDGSLPITINKDTVIKAVAIKNGVRSAVTQLNYTAAPRLSSPIASIASGSVVARGSVVTLSSVDDAEIFYTMDGTEPAEPGNSSVIEGNTATIEGAAGDLVMVKAYAKLKDKTNSETATFTYKISEHTGGITADTPSGTELSAGTTVNLISDVSDATIYYTTDGSSPTTASSNGSAVKINGTPGSSITLKAMAVSAGGVTKAYGIFSYKIKLKPTEVNASPASSKLSRATDITLTAAAGSIYYTIDGSDPTVNSNLYTEPIKITKATTIKAVAVTEDGESSDIVAFTYTCAAKVANIEASIEAGVIDPGSVLKLTTATKGAVIYYSTDGTKPTNSNQDKLLAYTTEGIVINRSVTIKAAAYLEDMQTSNVFSSEFVIDKIPAVEEKERLEKLAEEEKLHDSDLTILNEGREQQAIQGTKYQDLVVQEFDNHTIISCDSGVLPKTVELKTKRLNKNSAVNDAVKSYFGNDYAVLAMFDIEISAEELKIQPDGEVEIGIPIPEGYESAALSIIYINADNQIEKLETRRHNGMAYANTNHFSQYALVGMDENSDKSFSFHWIYIVIIVAVYSFIFVIIYGIVTIRNVKRRRKLRQAKKESN